jgi:hypothetical protein
MAPSTIRKRLRLVAIALVAVVVVVVAQVGRVSAAGGGETANVQRARLHFLAGKRAFEDAHYPKALREFQDGYALEPRPGFLLNMGHTARRMGQQREAREFYVRFLATSPPAAEQRIASQLVAEIDRELSHGAPAPAAAVVPAPTAVEPPPAPMAPPGEAAPVLAQVTVVPVPAAAPAPAAPRASPVTATPRPPLKLRAPAPAAEARTSTSAATTLTASPSAPRDEASGPIYRRWWFWAGAGAVVAGALTAILVGTSGGSAARENGSWGQLRL